MERNENPIEQQKGLFENAPKNNEVQHFGERIQDRKSAFLNIESEEGIKIKRCENYESQRRKLRDESINLKRRVDSAPISIPIPEEYNKLTFEVRQYDFNFLGFRLATLSKMDI